MPALMYRFREALEIDDLAFRYRSETDEQQQRDGIAVRGEMVCVNQPRMSVCDITPQM